MRMVVVLPAPFGPRKPRTSPCSTASVMPSTAVSAPNFLVRWSRTIMRGPSTLDRARPGRLLRPSSRAGEGSRNLCEGKLAVPAAPSPRHLRVDPDAGVQANSSSMMPAARDGRGRQDHHLEGRRGSNRLPTREMSPPCWLAGCRRASERRRQEYSACAPSLGEAGDGPAVQRTRRSHRLRRRLR